ncbi:glycosyltransferase family 1 protein, partial [Escherichia coli]|nr:glycosyltransferase family 1 protein [Escherichia coli]
MDDIVISIPRFSLSGGNLVSLNVALYLRTKGFKVYAVSGFSKKKIEDVVLVKYKKGIMNSFANIICFLNLSVLSLFYKNYIATHHLSAILNFVRPAKFALVQDLESDFYPMRLRFLGRCLWKSYLKSENLIFTNAYLANKVCGDCQQVDGFAYVDSINEIEYKKDNGQVHRYDALLILRDGKYKGYNNTLRLFEFLNSSGIKTCLVNQSRNSIISKYNELILNGLPRKDFLKLLCAANYFICLSEWEGLGLPNFEAISLGVKVISNPIPSALIIKDNFPSVISLNTSFNEIRELIKSSGLINNCDVSEFFVAQ